MEFLDRPITVTRITAAVCVANGTARTVHSDRPSHGFAYFYGGGTTYRFKSGQVICVQKGDLVYMPKHSHYTVEQAGGYDPECGCLAINFQVTDDSLFEPFKLRIKNTGEIFGLFQSIERKNRQRSAGYTEYCMSQLYRVIYLLKKEQKASYFGKRKENIIAPALEYIANGLASDELSVSRLAELCGVSESYFRRLFSSCTGASPVEYVRRRRLEYAKELLESGEYTVSTAALSSGFNDISYFSREFKKFYGISPKIIKNS